MKKIIYLINDLDTGGAEKAMIRICSKLKSSYIIRIVALFKGEGSLIKDINDNELHYKYLKFSKLTSFISNIKSLLVLYKYLKKNNDAILVCSLFHATIIGRVIGKIAGIQRIISWEHNQNFGNKIRMKLNILTAFLSSKIIMDSNAVFEQYINLFPWINGNKLITIPIGGVELSSFNSRNIESKNIVIVSVGSLCKQKGYDLLIQIANTIVKQNPHVIFKIAGEGEEKKILLNLVERNDIQKNFIFEGFVGNVNSFLSHADIYVQPSRWEGLCITVVEAIASSLPIVAFDVGGIKESVENKKNGFLIKPSRNKEFIDMLNKLITDKELRKKFGRVSRTIAEQKYDLRDMVSKFETLIND